MSSADVGCIVVGAGVVGLATACALARDGVDVLVLEAEARAGEGVSSRNSGVVHAGLYYPTGSLKARLCVRGRDLLYDYAARRGIPHRRLGKLVVASSATELPALAALYQRGLANGVRLHWHDAAAVAAIEPELQCVAAIESPDSGLVDVPEYVMALLGELQQAGGQVLCQTPARALHRSNGLLAVESAAGDRITCEWLVNAAGLGAIALAATLDGFPKARLPRLWYGAGHYYGCRRPVPFARLIYPLPSAGQLGIHLGFDLAGRPRFGPDLRFVEQPDYTFDDRERSRFAAAIRHWWPTLQDDDLQPDFVGVRPKLVGPGEQNPDFLIQAADAHGVAGLVNLFGIESPGLTASLAIGEHVARTLRAGSHAIEG